MTSPARRWLRAMLWLVFWPILVYSIATSVAWWRGEVALDEDWNWLGVVLLPLLVAIWWRYLSVFGCEKPACMLPGDGSVKH